MYGCDGVAGGDDRVFLAPHVAASIAGKGFQHLWRQGESSSENDCVIVPGAAAFLSVARSASSEFLQGQPCGVDVERKDRIAQNLAIGLGKPYGIGSEDGAIHVGVAKERGHVVRLESGVGSISKPDAAGTSALVHFHWDAQELLGAFCRDCLAIGDACGRAKNGQAAVMENLLSEESDDAVIHLEQVREKVATVGREIVPFEIAQQIDAVGNA